MIDPPYLTAQNLPEILKFRYDSADWSKMIDPPTPYLLLPAVYQDFKV